MRFIAYFGGLAALALAIPVLADDKPASPTTPPANKDVKKYVTVNSVAGKLVKVDSGSSEVELEYHSGFGRYAKTEKTKITLADEIKVWFVTPPMKVDENGDSKKMTPAELDKIKSRSGPTKGLYAGDAANLHAGQEVRVVIGKLKDAPKKPASKDKDATAEKDFLFITQIVVTADDKASTKSGKNK